MRVVVYRVMPKGQTGPNPTWHTMSKCHMERGCGVAQMRSGSVLVRQVFDTDDAYEMVFCSRCGGAFRHDPRYDILRIGADARSAHVDRGQRRWAKAYTPLHTVVARSEPVLVQDAA